MSKKRLLLDLFIVIVRNRQEPISLANLRKQVWKDHVGLQGWKSRVERALMRLRQELPPTIIPLFYVEKNAVHVLNAAFSFKVSEDYSDDLNVNLNNCLSYGPCNTHELAKSLGVSIATIKRHIKNLVMANKVLMIRKGRQVTYQVL